MNASFEKNLFHNQGISKTMKEFKEVKSLLDARLAKKHLQNLETLKPIREFIKKKNHLKAKHASKLFHKLPTSKPKLGLVCSTAA